MYHTKRKTNKTLNILLGVSFITLLFGAVHTDEWAAFIVLTLFYGIYVLTYYTESYTIDREGNIIIKNIYHTHTLYNIKTIDCHKNKLTIVHENGNTEIEPSNRSKFITKIKDFYPDLNVEMCD